MYKSSADNRLKSGEIFLKISCQCASRFMPVEEKTDAEPFFISRRAKKFTRRPVSK